MFMNNGIEAVKTVEKIGDYFARVKLCVGTE
jgi:hypothetical protein